MTWLEVRFLGAVMTIFGAFGLIATGLVMSLVNQTLKQTGKFHPKANYAATPEEQTALFAVFGVFLVLGLALLVVGGWEWKTGKRNARLEIAVLALGAAVWFISEIVPFLFF